MWGMLRAAGRREPLQRHAVRRSALLQPALSSLDARWMSSDASPTDEGKLVKRKVALVAGYLGTGYHGVQLNKDVPTIENELREAIFKAGAMRESNFVDLSKIDWSRSSRTDKGVHAGCIVFAGKLLIDEEKTVDQETGRVRGLAESLNAALPPTIRIFSATRVNKRFSARKNCVLREYEYFMPLSFLKSSFLASSTDGETPEWNEDEVVQEFCKALRRYEGIHDFHNFTKSRSFFYKQHAQFGRKKAADEASESETEEVVEVSEEPEDEESEDVTNEAEEGNYMNPEYSEQFADSKATKRKPLPRHRRAIYSCSGSLIRDFSGEPFLRVHIVGQAFLLHQIRCMVGGAIAVATKGMSRTQFAASIDTNRIVRIPIAPAEGLVLMSSTFGGKLHTVSLYEDQNTQLATEQCLVSHRVLLGQEEDEAMRKFREDVIYQEVIRAWTGVTDVEKWRAYLARSFEANEAISEEEVAALLEEAAEQHQEKKQRQSTFVQNNRMGVIKESRPRGVLPRQFTTKLCVRYAVAPGIFTNDLRRGIARHLRNGKIPVEADEEQLFAYVDRYGVERLAEEGRNLRVGLTFDGKERTKFVREKPDRNQDNDRE